MERERRKNAAGDWLRGELISRIAVLGMILMAYAGFALGFAVRGLPSFEGPAGTLAALIFMAAVVLTIVGFWLYLRRTDATWLRGLRAEQRIGDLIEHALAGAGCAFALDVKEALNGSGNVDHVVMTPAGIWVVETKSGWLSKRQFPQALLVAVKLRRGRASAVGHHGEQRPLDGKLDLVLAGELGDEIGQSHPAPELFEDVHVAIGPGIGHAHERVLGDEVLGRAAFEDAVGEPAQALGGGGIVAASAVVNDAHARALLDGDPEALGDLEVAEDGALGALLVGLAQVHVSNYTCSFSRWKAQ